MANYSNSQTAKRDFLYFDHKYQSVLRNFNALFEGVLPELKNIDGLHATLDPETHIFTVECYGRRFLAEIAAVVNGAEVQGRVDFSEIFENRRRQVESFFVTHDGHFADLSEKKIAHVSDWSGAQPLFVMNLLHLGLSKPPERFSPIVP